MLTLQYSPDWADEPPEILADRQMRVSRAKVLGTVKVLERYNQQREILQDLVRNCVASRCPITLVKVGSSVYKDHGDFIDDLDLYAVLSSETLGNYSEDEFKVAIGVPDSFQMPSKREMDMMTNDYPMAKMVYSDGYINGINVNIKWTTDKKIKEMASPIDSQPRSVLSRWTAGKSVRQGVKTSVRSVMGNEFFVPSHCEGDEELECLFSVKPGILKVEDGGRMVPVIPFLYDELMISEIIVDQSGTNISRFIQSTMWRSVTRAILHYNNLYDELGKPKHEAYDPKYILNLFVRSPYFSTATQAKYIAVYRTVLDEIRNH